MAQPLGVQFFLGCAFALALLLACGLSSAENGDSSEQYYSVTLEVEDRSAAARERALEKALAIVLRRMTGRPQVAAIESLRTALDQADRLALSFGYERLATGGSAINVRFDSRGVRQVIKDAGLSVWSLERPRVMAWVLIESEAGEVILDAASSHVIASAMQQSAAEFGVPLIFPLMDIDERLEMAPMLLRGLFFDALRQASRRYDTEFFLIGRAVQREDGVWSGNWTLSQPGASVSELDTSGEAENIARDGLGFVLEALSSRFALDMGGGEHVRISIEGVRALAEYAALLRYLRALDGVERAELRALSKDMLTLDVWLATSWEGFLDLLAQDRRLVPTFVVNLPEGEKRMIWRVRESPR